MYAEGDKCKPQTDGDHRQYILSRLIRRSHTGSPSPCVGSTGKDVTIRRAVAAGTVTTTATVIDLLRRDSLPKGDAIATARVAGIMGAKRTPDLLPLCHPIALHGVSVELTLRDIAIDIEVAVKTADRTGVEMEALTAVATAGLALIDMIKAVDPAASLGEVRVLRKEGGKTGTWTRP
jgi:cyclic pyranopterin phosphate synthase